MQFDTKRVNRPCGRV